MLTAMSRAAAQRLLLRTTIFTVPCAQAVARVACRALSTTQWTRLAAKATASSTTIKKTTATKKPAAKKPAAKKPAAKQSAAKNAAPKKKAVAKKKKPAAKKAKRKVKKVLSPEEKLKANMRVWRKQALLHDEPKFLPITAWSAFVADQMKGLSGDAPTMRENMAKLSERFKNLPSDKIERFEEIAKQNRIDNHEAYTTWVGSMTPIEVANANSARMRIRKVKNNSRTPAPIRDERQPKMPQRAYSLFTTARWATGELAGQRPADASKVIAEQWKKLAPHEKATYEAMAEADLDRYEHDVRTVLGRSIRRAKSE